MTDGEKDVFDKLKYVPNIFAATSFLLLFIIAVIFFFGRTMEFLRITPVLKFFPDFYQHISNFSISYILYSAIGYDWMILGVKFRFIMVLGATILLTNIIYELWIPIINTPDLTDAYYSSTAMLSHLLFYW